MLLGAPHSATEPAGATEHKSAQARRFTLVPITINPSAWPCAAKVQVKSPGSDWNETSD